MISDPGSVSASNRSGGIRSEGARPASQAGPHRRQGRPARPVAGVRLGLAGWASFGVKKEKRPMAGEKIENLFNFQFLLKFANYFEFTSNSNFEHLLLTK
jgi:hypothetical protein